MTYSHRRGSPVKVTSGSSLLPEGVVYRDLEEREAVKAETRPEPDSCTKQRDRLLAEAVELCLAAKVGLGLEPPGCTELTRGLGELQGKR